MILFKPSWVSKTAATFYQFETFETDVDDSPERGGLVHSEEKEGLFF